MSLTLDARLERVLRFLALATTGKLSDRIPLEDDGEERLLELEYGVNMLFDELERSRTESAAQQRELEQQSAALLEKEREMVRLLSTPVITVWPGVLALPILGEVGRERAVTMTESLLNQVVQERATHVILDLTGMTVVGAETAMSLLRLAQSVRLLGGRCLLTGVSGPLASVLVGLSFESSDVVALPTLADAIAKVLRERGEKLVTQSK